MEITQTLTVLVAFLTFAIISLGFMYWYMSYKEKVNKDSDNKENEDKSKKTNQVGIYTKLSVFDFLEFDKIEDNMIIQNNGTRYLMVIGCEGVNYDLMSEVEKNSVEAGFVQFLNTLRHPVQLYTQTRTVDISSSVINYQSRLDQIKKELDFKSMEYKSFIASKNYVEKQAQSLKMEMIRLQNLYDYGQDVITNIQKMSQNKNVLRKHYYIVVPYYTSEMGTDELAEEEKRNMIFSELYTRAQSIIRTLFACSMKCRILNSNELTELLYVAYNRDETEVYGIDKALQAGYNELYSTAEDVLDKKMKALDAQIEEEAIELVNDTVEEVKTEKHRRIEKKEETFEELVKKMAVKIINDNKNFIGKNTAEVAIDKINETNEEGEDADEKEGKTKTSSRVAKSV